MNVPFVCLACYLCLRIRETSDLVSTSTWPQIKGWGQVILTVPPTKAFLVLFIELYQEIWYYSRLTRWVLTIPVLSFFPIFSPDFPRFSQIFPDFPRKQDQKQKFLSRFRQFGKWLPVSSCLVSFQTSSGRQTSNL